MRCSMTVDCETLLLCWAGAASGIVDHLRRRFARFDLSAHFLDLRCLLCEACCESLNFLLLLQVARKTLGGISLSVPAARSEALRLRVSAIRIDHCQ